MKKAETVKVMTTIAANYRNFDVDDFKVELWYDMLKDLPFPLVMASVKMVMMSSKYPPTIAEIREGVVKLSDNQGITAGEAWGEVTRGIAKFGSYDPEGAFSIMSPMTLKVVKQLSWREICSSENISVTRGQFIKIYDSLRVREEHEKLLPEGFKDSVKLLAEKLSSDRKLLGG